MNAAQREIAAAVAELVAKVEEQGCNELNGKPFSVAPLLTLTGKLRTSDFTVVIPDKSKPSDFEIVPSPGGVVL